MTPLQPWWGASLGAKHVLCLILYLQKSRGNSACTETAELQQKLPSPPVSMDLSLCLWARVLHGFYAFMSIVQAVRGENTHWARCKDQTQCLVMIYYMLPLLKMKTRFPALSPLKILWLILNNSHVSLGLKSSQLAPIETSNALLHISQDNDGISL